MRNLAYGGVAEDLSFKAPLRKEAEAVFAARKGKADFVPYEFDDWKGSLFRFAVAAQCLTRASLAGTVHGFAARPDMTMPEVKAGYEGAFQKTVTWFRSTLL